MARDELLISFEAARAIQVHLELAPELEQGGALGGLDDLVVCVVWLPNEADEDRRFAWHCSPERQYAAVTAIELQGLELLGTYHSHPEGNAEPSAEDIRAAEAVGAELIVATHASEPERPWPLPERPWDWRACLPDPGKTVPVRVLAPHSLPGRTAMIDLSSPPTVPRETT